MSDPLVVTVVGAGALGAAMATRLAETNYHVRLWNRTPTKARSVAADVPGIEAVEDIVDAVRDASVVFTVLRDGESVAEVMGTVIDALPEGAIWVQASTVGPSQASSLRELADQHAVAYLDAPVSGSTGPARNGRLVWLVAGRPDVLNRARPVLTDLGSSIVHVGDDVQGSSVKLAVNAWMTAVTVAMSDVLALCDALGIEHEVLARALDAGPLAMRYAEQKANAMDERSYTAGFAVRLALKDLDLAADVEAPSALLRAVRQRLEQTIAAGHGDDDLAAVDYPRPSLAHTRVGAPVAK